MDGLLGGNWIGSGESIFYRLVQLLFAASALRLIADLRYELLRFLLCFILRHFHRISNISAAVPNLQQAARPQFPVSASVSIVATRFFTASCTFSNERPSIWRTRSGETPNSDAKSASVIGSSASRRASKIRRSRSLSTQSTEASVLRRESDSARVASGVSRLGASSTHPA